MKILKRNRQIVWYALNEGKEKVLDEKGYYTGETKIKYSDPVEVYASISPADGSISEELFGDISAYDRILTLDQSLPVTDTSVFWIDHSPDTGIPYEYRVKQIKKTLNFMLVQVSKIDVS